CALPICGLVVDGLRTGNEALRLARRVVDLDDLVVLAVQQERRHVEPLQVLREIRLRERLHAFVRALQSHLRVPAPELVEQALRYLGTVAVRAEEGDRKVPIELRPIRREVLANT